jgi:hypothetical protein
MACKPSTVFMACLLVLCALPAQAQWETDYNIMAPEPGRAPKSHRPPRHEVEPATQPEQQPPPEQKAAKSHVVQHPRGSSTLVTPTPLPPPLHYNPPPVPTVASPVQPVPPSMYVPQTGQTLRNLPGPAGNGPGGSETSQDRALRCAHQAGVYGPAQTGNPNAYIGSCINQ